VGERDKSRELPAVERLERLADVNVVAVGAAGGLLPPGAG
jgi:hypothetical protein